MGRQKLMHDASFAPSGAWWICGDFLTHGCTVGYCRPLLRSLNNDFQTRSGVLILLRRFSIKEGMEEMIAVVKENSENNPPTSKKKGYDGHSS